MVLVEQKSETAWAIVDNNHDSKSADRLHIHHNEMTDDPQANHPTILSNQSMTMLSLIDPMDLHQYSQAYPKSGMCTNKMLYGSCESAQLCMQIHPQQAPALAEVYSAAQQRVLSKFVSGKKASTLTACCMGLLLLL